MIHIYIHALVASPICGLPCCSTGTRYVSEVLKQLQHTCRTLTIKYLSTVLNEFIQTQRKLVLECTLSDHIESGTAENKEHSLFLCML